MAKDEQRSIWQSRIEAFQANGESSVTAWCAANDISVPSMYAYFSSKQLLHVQPNSDGIADRIRSFGPMFADVRASLVLLI